MGNAAGTYRKFQTVLLLALAGLGTLLSLLAFLHLRQIDEAERWLRGERQAGIVVAALQEALDHHRLVVNALAGLFSSARTVSRPDFHAFVGRMLPLARGQRAVAWLPRVAVADRAAFERAAAAQGLAGYAVRTDGDPADVFPALFIEPSHQDDPLQGLDFASLPEWRTALLDAGDTGRTVIARHRADGTVLLVAPVYRGGGGLNSLTERRAALKGFAAVILTVDTLAAAAIADAPQEADLYLFDLEAAADPLLHFRPAPAAGARRSALPEAEVLAAPHLRRTLSFAGRTWTLVLQPAAPAHGAGPWMALTGGLALTGLLSLLGFAGIARWRRSDQLTAAISDSNDTLRREIAERREIETAMRRAEERLRLAIKSTPLSLFTQDRALRYNWIFKSRLGLTPEETVGRTDFEIMGSADATLLTALKRRVLDTGVGLREEVHLHRNGRGFDVQLTLEPLYNPAGIVVGVIGSALDVTHERDTQKRLAEARAEAERANEAKSRFLAAASHDLRQPLQATRLFLEVLQMRLSEPAVRSLADKALTALEATDGLLNALLDVSTLEAGVVEPDIGDFPVARLLERLASEAMPQAAERGLTFRWVSSRAVVRSDPVLLERMIRNLVANSLRYTESGTILLGCRRASADRLRIDVCDTGPGIPADKLEIIFEDFYQLGNAERDRTRGLGLGLSVVDRMAQLLRHQVCVRSREGHGSIFSVLVPVVAWADVSENERLKQPVG